METETEKPAAHCEVCAEPLYRGQVAIEGGLTHELATGRTRRTFYCSQGCADARS